MQPGSLVMYVGGQKNGDIEKGLGLETDKIYLVQKIGIGKFGSPAVRKRAVVLAERPGQIHNIKLFKEIQAPFDLSFLFN